MIYTSYENEFQYSNSTIIRLNNSICESTVLAIKASIIQGSVTGPTAYVLNASDLLTIEPSNSLDKYADDTYLIVPASKSQTILAELDNVSAWAVANNLSLNVAKSCEMIVRRPT